MGEPDPQQRRGPGRPRKWANNAERMRAYRARQRAETDQLRGIDGRGELLDRLHQITAERDALQVEVNELRRRVRDLETTTRPPPATPGEPPPLRPARAEVAGQPGLSRAQRRRLEREQRRRNH